MNLKILSNKGFTLVELIIVVVIISLLATIGFISFQSYLSKARGAKRFSTIRDIETSLNISIVRIGNLPLPDNSIEVLGRGEKLGFQGNIGENVSRILSISKTPEDPKIRKKYTYFINNNKTKYQLLFFTEN